ncbi:Cobalamin biosynthesis protein CobD [Candidatus Magnetomoraceae bacterium gMMP-1]
MNDSYLYIIAFAFVLDLILGDPRWLPHPIRWMGMGISFFEPYFRKMSMKTINSGCFFAVFLIVMTWIITWLIVILAGLVHPVLSILFEIIIIFYTFSVKSLQEAAMDIYHILKHGTEEEAKQRLAYIVGRDTKNLDEKGIIRAAIETVAENLVDGFISPLFFAALGGAPLAMAYKMVNTLDSMIGYKNEKYLEFGRFAAKIDDIANFIPARISIFVISISASIFIGSGLQALKTGIKEGSHHTSPNAGYSEAAVAGAMGIKLNGPNYYEGKLVDKPYLGKDFDEVCLEDIRMVCGLMVVSSMLWLFFCLGIRLLNPFAF